jgi:3-methyl-2-oxobutanoate hydroxymethyltransferase
MAPQGRPRRVRIGDLLAKKELGEPIVQLAVTNYRDAVVADRIGVDIVTASDVAVVTVLGREDTLSATLDEMCLIGRAVATGVRRALRIVAMPYWTFHVSPAQAVDNAGRLIQATGADALELEVNRNHAAAVQAIVAAGIPVQAHIGLSGHRIPQLGGVRGIGKTATEAVQYVEDAELLVEAGAFSLICELLSTELTEHLAKNLPVPVVSLGSGWLGDGVSVVSEDLFGLYEEHVPRHARVYEQLIPRVEKGMSEYVADVRSRHYPGPEHSIAMPTEERRRFTTAVTRRAKG